MSIKEIRMMVQMWSLVSEMNSVLVGVEGMKVANESRRSQGYAPAYPEDCFSEAERQLMDIANRKTKLLGGEA